MPYRYISGNRIECSSKKQKNDNSMFNRVVMDVYKQIKYRKRNVWCYLPTKEHLDSLIEKLNKLSIRIELEIIEEKDYIKVRRK